MLPFVETAQLPSGKTLIPVDSLERLLGERRRPAQERRIQTTPGRPSVVAPDIVRRIRAERAAGKSLRQIAAGLNADGTATAHGGAQWWPSTVRAVLRRKATD